MTAPIHQTDSAAPIAKVIAEARGMLGTRFAHMGRSAFSVDCVGLLVLAGQRAGLLPQDFRTRSYSRVINPEVLHADLEEWLDPVAANLPPQAGDVVVFAMGNSEQHVGLITEVGPAGWRFIHAHEGGTTGGKVVERRMDPWWQARMRRLYRWRSR
jgi:cell wall-associated NlpC family hydrolase